MDFRDGENFIGELGFTTEFTDDRCVGEADLVPELLGPTGDSVSIAVLATLADIVAGILANQATKPRVCMTVDLDVRMYGFPTRGNVTAAANILKSGRTTTVVETVFTVDGAPPFATSNSTFIASPRPQDVVEIPPGTRRYDGRRLTLPLVDRVGCRVVAPGTTEVERHPDVLNPANTLQGGVIALMAEWAAATAGGGVRRVHDLDVRYLSAVRAGPARAEAALLGEVGDGALVRVEVRDTGNENRVTAMAAARRSP